MNDVWGIVISIIGLAVTILGGVAKFLWTRIGEVQAAQTTINTNVREEIAKIAGELRQSMQTQASDHRLAQGNIWTELRRQADKSSEQHAHAAENMGKLPTREEMMASLAAMEGRIMVSLRKEVPQR